MKKLIVYILLIIYSFLLCGCNTTPTIISFYLDDENFIHNDIKMKISCSSYGLSQNKTCTIYFKCTNTSTEDKYFMVENAYLINEETNVKYDASCYSSEIKLQYNIERSITINSTIPTQIEEENYYLSFTYNNETYNVYLYERPDNLRNNCTLTYKIYNNTVLSTAIKQGRTITNIYSWESPDLTKYCNEWYLDSSYQSKYTSNMKINNDTILYGLTKNIWSFMSDNSGYFITSINYIPKNGIINIPKSISDKKINISSYVIKNNAQIKEIYLPITLNKIYSGNFKNMPNLTKIHFEGYASQWDQIIQSDYSTTIPDNVEIIFNSIY